MMGLIYTAHATVAIALLLLSVGFLRLARRRRRSILGDVLDRAFIMFVVLLWLVINVRHPLSLNLIEIIGLAAPLALASGRWPFRAALYFWSGALLLQMILIPRFDLGPIQLGFWFYWLGHAGIIAAAAYDLLVNRYRPNWRDCICACAAILLYDGFVIPSVNVNQRLALTAMFVAMTIVWSMPRREQTRKPAAPIVDLEEDSELIYST
jgi:uncharacterized membrane protein YwaF